MARDPFNLDSPIDPGVLCEQCWEPIVATAVWRQGFVVRCEWRHKVAKGLGERLRHAVKLSRLRDRYAVAEVRRQGIAQRDAAANARAAAKRALAGALAGFKISDGRGVEPW